MRRLNQKLNIMSLTTKLNYNKLMALKPTVYSTITNVIGQKMDLVEHPLRGDEYPVIIIYHAEKLAICSEFYDTDDMEAKGDYEPIYMHGEMLLKYEVEL